MPRRNAGCMTSSPPFSNHIAPQHIAGIDIGTNTVRLLIARAESDHQLVAVYLDQVITRLGKGLQQRGALHASAMDRTIHALQRWRPLLVQHDVTRPITVATGAARDATNQSDFLRRVREEAGLGIEVLSGEEEARRTLVGIAAGLSPPITNILAMDIGGGSTEFIAATSGQSNTLYSTNLGVVRLTERFFHSDPILEKEIAQAQDWILDQLQPLKTQLSNIGETSLIGTAGTITTLAAIDQELANYDPRRVHRYPLSLATIQRIKNACVSKTTAERQRMVGIEAGRADVIVAGILLLHLAMDMLGFSTIIVSEYGLREGILVDHVQRTTGALVSLKLF